MYLQSMGKCSKVKNVQSSCLTKVCFGLLAFALVDPICARRVQTKEEMLNNRLATNAAALTAEPNDTEPALAESSSNMTDRSEENISRTPSADHRRLAVMASSASIPLTNVTIDLDEAGERDPFSILVNRIEKLFGVVGLRVLLIAFLFLVLVVAIIARRLTRRSDRNQFKLNNGKVAYEWQQTDTKMFMYILLPGSIESEDDLDIRISPMHVRIARLGQKHAFIKDQLYRLVNDEESSWKINKGGELEICFVKSEPGEWPCVLLPHLPSQPPK